MTEMIDVINDNNEVVQHESREIVHAEGLPHRVSAVLLIRSDGKYMIPTASDKKVEAGGLFHSAGGHVAAGESYRACAARELWEEAGLRVEETACELIGSYWLTKEYPSRKEKERFEVFKVTYHPNMGEIELNYEQVNPQWFSLDQLKEFFIKKPESLSYPLRLTLENLFK